MIKKYIINLIRHLMPATWQFLLPVMFDILTFDSPSIYYSQIVPVFCNELKWKWLSKILVSRFCLCPMKYKQWSLIEDCSMSLSCEQFNLCTPSYYFNWIILKATEEINLAQEQSKSSTEQIQKNTVLYNNVVNVENNDLTYHHCMAVSCLLNGK